MADYIRHCPHCKADFQGEEIPEKHRELFGGKTHVSRLIACCSRDLGRVTHFECPDCHARIEHAEAYQ